MTTPYPKRLIEVDLPIARISAHARREKSIRQGHISTLHIWWARRPLAACRAVILASLWPDPVDVAEWAKEADAKGEVRAPKGEALKPGEGVVIRPKRFLDEARQRMIKWSQIALGKTSNESYKLLVQVSKNPKLLDDPTTLRTALLDFIADFADWDHSNDVDYLDTARALVQAGHEALGGEAGTRPTLFDPFAGGGSIPLEVLRVGADSFASDLNPIPVLLNKVAIEYIPKFGQGLADEVRRWGQWVKERAQEQLGEFYPKAPTGAVPIAYLWARTILSEAPDQGDMPVEIPLMRSLWLAKRSARDAALRWQRTASGKVKTEQVEVRGADGRTRRVLRPKLEIFYPTSAAEVETGTMSRGAVTCPVTGYTTPVTSVRQQLGVRRGGSADARLLAVRQDDPRTGDRQWREPSSTDIAAALEASLRVTQRQTSHAGELSWIPDEPLPAKGTLGFRVQGYGMQTWGDLFTPRQLLCLGTFSEIVSALGRDKAIEDPILRDAVCVMLSLAVDRLADFSSSLCVLNSVGGRGVVHTFGRQALPMVWDFMETNPFNDVGASWDAGIEACVDTIGVERHHRHSGTVMQASADASPLPSDSAVGIVTDPPYYDAVPYADLSDYFMVWLRRSLGKRASEFGISGLSPKDKECIVDPVRKKDAAFFEQLMGRAMLDARRVVMPSGFGIVVFAHKSTTGWEAQLKAMIDGGWTVTGSWPIDTERPGRLRAQDSAALASSVHLVVRPRERVDGAITSGEAGEWREILNELPIRLSEWMPRLADEGVVGADAIFACLGPALEIFSRYSRVEKASGEAVTLREYLEHVWAAVSSEALSMIFKDADAAGLEPDARLTAMWLWTLGGGKPQSSGEGEDGEEAENDEEEETTSKKGSKVAGFVLEFDAARKIAQGLGIHLEKSESIVEVKGESARLLPVSERTRHLFGKDAEDDTAKTRKAKKKAKQGSLFEELDAIEAEAASTGGRFGGLEGAKPGATVLDKVHQSMILFAAGRGEALKRFLVEDGVGKDGRFWKLAQSLSALYPSGTDEKRWVDGVLARKKGLGF